MIIRCDSAAMVPKTKELLPEPETPVNTVIRRLGTSTETSRKLFSRAPRTRMRSWPSAVWTPSGEVSSDMGSSVCGAAPVTAEHRIDENAVTTHK
ncbi:hypothetical protein GCM10009596_17280 [Arthrobacter rhombi]